MFAVRPATHWLRARLSVDLDTVSANAIGHGLGPCLNCSYFPSSLVESADARAALHAKCIVVDVEHVFVSSANFTEAAQQRNVEVGLRLQTHSLGTQLARFFDEMLAADLLRTVFET